MRERDSTDERGKGRSLPGTPGPEAAERGGAVHGELDGEGGRHEDRERRGEVRRGRERHAGREEEDHEALAGEQRRRRRRGRGGGGAREPGHGQAGGRAWSARYANACVGRVGLVWSVAGRVGVDAVRSCFEWARSKLVNDCRLANASRPWLGRKCGFTFSFKIFLISFIR